MAKIFVSFLGIGANGKNPGYDEAAYNWPGKSDDPIKACFAQTAILKILQEYAHEEGPVDKVIFLCTKESRDKHLTPLLDELAIHVPTLPEPHIPEPLVPTDMSAANQWGWFEQLLQVVGQNDTLIIDFTHGMRAVPIVFSSAISFLQRAKNVKLAHALYAWYDRARTDVPHPIIDMREFYVINDWAEAVSRLTDDADARKLGELAASTDVEALRSLQDPALIQAFEEMTDCIRNVDVNHIGGKVSDALQRVEQAGKQASGSAQVMLELTREKFGVLNVVPSGRYDLPYFRLQLEIIRVLLEHRLFMQAYTAMRELLGSVGTAGLTGKYDKTMTGADGKKYRRRFAEVFVGMLQMDKEEWDVPPDQTNNGQRNMLRDQQTLKPWYEQLEDAQVITAQTREFAQEITRIRNGFDHVWTGVNIGDDIEAKGREHLKYLEKIVDLLDEHNLLSTDAEEGK
ncbi:MAG: TIGR02221 family CRISPR-associated protein [bacterium]|nr:TIGR02221 family CRISPR-associated protein [bacterium]